MQFPLIDISSAFWQTFGAGVI